MNKDAEEGEGTRIFQAPNDKIKNRRGGCFVCEVSKDYGRRGGKLLMRGYLPNVPFYPSGDIDVETEIIKSTKDPKAMEEAGKTMKVWIETTKGLLKSKSVLPLDERDLKPMGLETFRDTHLTWKLPDNIELTNKKLKHTLCMDLIGVQRGKVLKFRWPVEEVTKPPKVKDEKKRTCYCGGRDACR